MFNIFHREIFDKRKLSVCRIYAARAETVKRHQNPKALAIFPAVGRPQDGKNGGIILSGIK